MHEELAYRGGINWKKKNAYEKCRKIFRHSDSQKKNEITS